MNDWTLDRNWKPNEKRPARWRYWSRQEIIAAIERTEQEHVNFRSIDKYQEYTTIKRSGLWHPSPESIAIDDRERIVNGLNRFKSDRDAGVSGRWYLTVSHWPQDEDLGIDMNSVRTVTQWAKRHGIEFLDSGTGTATIRWAIRGYSRVPNYAGPMRDGPTLVRALECEPEAFSLALRTSKRTGFSAPIRAAFVRAYRHVPELDVALTGYISGERPDGVSRERFSPIQRLIEATAGPRRGQHACQLDDYAKTENALFAWAQHESLSKLYARDYELFAVDSLDNLWKEICERIAKP